MEQRSGVGAGAGRRKKVDRAVPPVSDSGKWEEVAVVGPMRPIG